MAVAGCAMIWNATEQFGTSNEQWLVVSEGDGSGARKEEYGSLEEAGGRAEVYEA